MVKFSLTMDLCRCSSKHSIRHEVIEVVAGLLDAVNVDLDEKVDALGQGTLRKVSHLSDA